MRFAAHNPFYITESKAKNPGTSTGSDTSLAVYILPQKLGATTTSRSSASIRLFIFQDEDEDQSHDR
jgi:hypothetical protein